MKKHLKLLAVLGVTSILVSSTSIPTFAEDFVLYDENGVHVETKGLTESPSKGTIGLYIESPFACQSMIHPSKFRQLRLCDS